ncbi:YlxQ family RNA-binding protein [Bacillus alkalicellulosilyticus]|uniref:YlxQ family RNA-binding protein n=1 Tax=Alkalihalobacterium alkalicellulosilyticum TaxID=1912214 RepID=UPI000998BE6A|nr:YlxQ family RNA-binding protein [Bacillus alkalicellulosilyticus]
MSEQQWLSLLGLAARARKVISGEEIVLKEVRRNGVSVVIISEDASDLTLKKMTDKCKHYNVPIRISSTRDKLGNSIGKGERVVLGVIDPGFARKLVTLIDQ